MLRKYLVVFCMGLGFSSLASANTQTFTFNGQTYPTLGAAEAAMRDISDQHSSLKLYKTDSQRTEDNRIELVYRYDMPRLPWIMVPPEHRFWSNWGSFVEASCRYETPCASEAEWMNDARSAYLSSNTNNCNFVWTDTGNDYYFTLAGIIPNSDQIYFLRSTKIFKYNLYRDNPDTPEPCDVAVAVNETTAPMRDFRFTCPAGSDMALSNVGEDWQFDLGNYWCESDLEETIVADLVSSCDDDGCGVMDGDKHLNEQLYSGAGLEANLNYHSSQQIQGTSQTLGHGWNHSYQSSASREGTTNQIGMVQSADGYTIPILNKVSQTGIPIYATSSNSGFDVVNADRSKRSYNSNGWLESTTAASGQTTTIQRETINQLNTANIERVDKVIGPWGHELDYQYHAARPWLLETIIDPAGEVITLHYDFFNRLTRIVYQDGHEKRFDYTGFSLTRDQNKALTDRSAFGYQSGFGMTAITDERGNIQTALRYDNDGRITHSQYGDGTGLITFDYAKTGDQGQTIVTDAHNHGTTYEFTRVQGATKKIVAVEDALGRTTRQHSAEYGHGRVEWQTDARGNRTKREYDDYHVTRLIEAQGTELSRRTDITYRHPDSQLPKTIKRRSVRAGRDFVETRSYLINSNPNKQPFLIEYEGFRPDGTPISRTLEPGYNTYGQLTQLNGPRTDVDDIHRWYYHTCFDGGECGQLDYEENALGHITTYDDYDAHGRLKQMTDPNDVITAYDYDLRQRITHIRTIPPAGEQRESIIDYFPNGTIESITSPGNTVIEFTYDTVQRLKTATDTLGNQIEYGYDARGQRYLENNFDPNGELKRTLTSTFDVRKQLDTQDAAGSLSDLEYDPASNLKEIIDANINSTQFEYDALNRLVEIIDAENGIDHKTIIDYDVHDNITYVQTPNGAVTTYEYDDLGNLLKETSPDRGATLYEHDAAGNVTRVTDARGVVTDYVYDALNRLTHITYPGQPELNVVYTYDLGQYGVGRLHQRTDHSGSTTYTYDAFGNVIQQTDVRDSQAITFQYAYDANDQLTLMTYPSGRKVNYHRDSDGRITQVTHGFGNPAIPLANNISYLPFGPREDITYANGLTEDRTFDLQYRLTEQQTGDHEDVIYDLDGVGNVDLLTCSIDPLRNQDFDYDNLYRLTDADGAYGIHDYEYDENSNREFSTINSEQEDYILVPNSNQIDELLTPNGTQDYQYDLAGNATTFGDYSATYSHAGRMQTVSENGQLLATYRYNGLDERTHKLLSNTNTDIHYGYGLDSELLFEQSTDGTYKEYVYLHGEPLAMFTRQLAPQCGNGVEACLTQQTTNVHPGDPSFGQHWAVHFVHNDHLGTPQRLTDVSGDVAWTALYQPFGEADIINSQAAPDLEFNLRFPGQYWDQETGLHYNYHRYYNPATGRYITSDPVGLSGGINAYLYANANPTFFTDPYGLAPWALPQPIVDGFAGYGDSVSFDATTASRRFLNIDGGIKPCSKAYCLGRKIDEVIGYATFGKGLIKAGQQNLRSYAWRSNSKTSRATRKKKIKESHSAIKQELLGFAGGEVYGELTNWAWGYDCECKKERSNWWNSISCDLPTMEQFKQGFGGLPTIRP